MARAQVGGPVDDEEDVASLLLHDLVEEGDQLLVEELRLPPDLEQPEGKEGVEALAIAGPQKRPGRVLRSPWLLGWSDRDPVVTREQRDDLGVTPFFIALERDRLFQDRIGLLLSQSLDLHRRGGLRASGFVPDRQSLQALEADFVELRPADVLRAEGTVRVDEDIAEEAAVLLRADLEALHDDAILPGAPCLRSDTRADIFPYPARGFQTAAAGAERGGFLETDDPKPEYVF